MPFKPGRTFYDKYGNRYMILRIKNNMVICKMVKKNYDQFNGPTNLMSWCFKAMTLDFRSKHLFWGKPNEN